MNRDAITGVALKAYWELMHEFAASLEATFPKCPEIKDWCLYMRNVVGDDEKKRKEGILTWCDGMCAPLVKAKYAKAVQSITGKPATVYHAICYRDMPAVEASFAAVQPLGMPDKMQHGMDADARAVLWQYLDELATHALSYSGVAKPRVPTSDEIAADIARRRGASAALAASATTPPPALQQGLADAWQQLCAARGKASRGEEEGEPDLHARLSAVLAADHGSSSSLAALLRARDAAAFARLCEAFPSLGGEGPPTDAQWALLDKVLGLVAMEDAIPKPMMRGIESVANQLVQDLASGKVTNLDIEAIGRQVLSGVDQKDVADFANNLDKILPALERLHQQQ